MTVSLYIPLEHDNYNEYQKKVFLKIKYLYKKGLGYTQIAHYLNEKNIKTARGNLFKSNNVHSMLKKGLLRRKRLKNIKFKYDDIRFFYRIYSL